MNWRVPTAINALIAIVTISAVVYAASHIRPSRAERRTTSAKLHSRNEPAAHLSHTNSFRDITDVRVDKLASVPSSELYEVLSRTTPEQIAALALKFNDLSYDAPTLGTVGTFFQTWANIDGKAALAAAFRLRDLRLERAAAVAVVESASPSLCGELALQLRDQSNLPSTPRKWEIESNFAFVWAEKNPQDCARWVTTLPRNEQPAAVSGLMLGWTDKNWTDASTWISTVNGELRDNAIASAINCCASENMPASQMIPLALSVTGPELRLSAITDAFSHWAIENREAALAWVKRSSLSPREKRAVL